jgi:hypothetical protein
VAVAVATLALVWQVAVVQFVIEHASFGTVVDTPSPHILPSVLVGGQGGTAIVTVGAFRAAGLRPDDWSAWIRGRRWTTAAWIRGRRWTTAGFCASLGCCVLSEVDGRQSARSLLDAYLGACHESARARLVYDLGTLKAYARDDTSIVRAQIAVPDRVRIAVARRRVGLLSAVIAASRGASTLRALVANVVTMTASGKAAICLVVFVAEGYALFKISASAIDAHSRKAIGVARASSTS